jgi:hypothetical protein
MGDRDHSFDSFQDDVDDDSHSLLEKFQPLRNRKQSGFLYGRCGHFLFIQITLIILYTAMFFLLVDLFIDRQSIKKDLVYCKIIALLS